MEQLLIQQQYNNVILNDKEVDVVVEVIGGLEPAYSFVSKSLAAGKSVVTSNKE